MPSRILLTLALALSPSATALVSAQQTQLARLEVLRHTPSRNALGVAQSSAIRLTFSQPLSATSVNAQSVRVFGRFSGAHAGTIQLSSGRHVVSFTPEHPFSPGELVQVTLSRTLESDLGQHLARGYAWSFWTDSRTGAGTYTQTGTLFPGDTPYGVHGGDIDADGDLDLCIPNEGTSDVSVYLNQGGGTFGPETTYAVGFHCSANAAADFDQDGDVDLVVANILDDDLSVLRGNGNGTFQPQLRHASGAEPRGVAVLDVDADGDTDFVSANRVTSDLSLFRNGGAGTFAPESRFNGGLNRETGVGAADMDGDGTMDLVVIGYSSHDAAVLRGDGRGAFLPLTPRALDGSGPWKLALGDVNGDGFVDLAAACSNSDEASLVLGDGAGGLLPATTYATGSFPIAIELGDLNGDELLDLAVSCYGQDFDLYKNLGAGVMGNRTVLTAPSAASCLTLHDRDGDGDIDVTAVDELADRVLLFRQDG
ncbi:MAG: FG-GAP-like repeat-containing protein [Planctomycetota bacterium]